MKISVICRIAASCLAVAVFALLPGCQGGSDPGSKSAVETYTVSFNLGYSGAPSAPAAVTVKGGKSLGDKLPADPKREGYTFDGWYAGGTRYTGETVIIRNVTLVAEWEKLPPPEAALFENLDLATPLKEYGHGNPIMTQAFGADPNILVYDDRLYVFMTADTLLYSGGQVTTHDYGTIRSLRVVSTTDMANWTQHPEIQVARNSGSAATWASNSWAPALAMKEVNGQMKIFLYFSNSTNVAVISAEHPLGPWTSPRTNNLVTSSTPNCSDVVWVFDPAVLVDDDGKAYLYFGGGTPSGGSATDWTSNHPNPGTFRVVELGADMASIVGTPVRLSVPFGFEASEINKIGNTYYYSYSSNPQVLQYAKKPDEFPNAVIIGDDHAIAYATSDNPMTGFELRGSILHNPGKMFDMPYNNNHHKMFEYKGKRYVVYHAKLLQSAMNINMEYNYRSPNVNEVTINPDGTIQLVTGTREGVPQDGYFDPYQLTSAATMAVMAGISTRNVTGSTERMKVTDIHSGDWIALRGVDFGNTGAKKFSCKVTPPASGTGVIQIRQDSLTGKPIGYVVIEAGGNSEITVDLLRTVTGVRDLVFVFSGEGYEFEEWRFSAN